MAAKSSTLIRKLNHGIAFGSSTKLPVISTGLNSLGDEEVEDLFAAASYSCLNEHWSPCEQEPGLAGLFQLRQGTLDLCFGAADFVLGSAFDFPPGFVFGAAAPALALLVAAFCLHMYQELSCKSGLVARV